MLINYKYKLWEAVARIAPSQEAQERLFYKLSSDLGITTRQLKKYLNIKATDAADMPAAVLLTLSAYLDIQPTQAVNYQLPTRPILETMKDPAQLKKRFHLSK